MNNEKIKEILKKAKVDAFFMNFLPSEKVNIEISADIETACWSFIPPHRIVVGNEKHHSKRSENYIQSLLWHELSHAKWTERDFKKINIELKGVFLLNSIISLKMLVLSIYSEMRQERNLTG